MNEDSEEDVLDGDESFDERVSSVREQRQKFEDVGQIGFEDIEPGSSLIFDEAGSEESDRIEAAAMGADYARRMEPIGTNFGNGISSTGLGSIDRSNQKRIERLERSLSRVEGKIDALLAALDVNVGGSDE